jgi:peptidoglycan/LPS O-acetylase OafA/YrhL
MSIASWCHWLQNTPFATGIRQSDLLFPLIEGSHILSLSLSVGLILIFDLRLLRLAFRSESASRIMKQLMPWAMPGFALMFLTGLLLFVSQAGKVYGNTFFRFKLVFLLLAGVNALIYQVKFYPKMAEWDKTDFVPRGAQLSGAVSLILWACIIALGRTMAYEL